MAQPVDAAAWSLGPAEQAELQRLRLVGQCSLLPPRSGERPSQRFGLGYDLADYQAYRPGDRIRHLDWRRFFLTGGRERFVRRFYAELSSDNALLVDASASMDTYPEDGKLAAAQRLGLALAFASLRGHEPVDLAFLGGAPAVGSAGGLVNGERFTSVAALTGAMDSIGGIRAAGAADLAAIRRGEIALRHHYGSLTLISDLYGDPEHLDAALDALGERAGRLHVIHLVGDHDLEPLADDGDVVFEDPETGAATEVYFDRAEHRRHVLAILDEARAVCDAREASYVRLRCPLDFPSALAELQEASTPILEAS